MKRHLMSFAKNEVFTFTLMKYLIHVLNFARVLIAAKLLGPFDFGIWGFLNLAIQYLSHTLLGVQYSINLELATAETPDRKREENLISSALFITLAISSVLIAGGLFIYLADVSLFERYHFSRYSLFVAIIVSLLHFQQIFFNIFRIYAKFYKIAIAELIVSVSLLVTLFFFEGSNLLEYLFIVWILSLAVALFMLFIDSPIVLRIKYYVKESVHLLKVGFPLLLYNLSYYLIIISSTTVLSQFYSVEAMGYYTLANSISNAILLGINSILWAFFPSFLARLREGKELEEVKETIHRINKIYVVAIFLIFTVFLLCSPVIYLFLEKFTAAEAALNLLFVTQIILATNFAANTFTMARRNYNHLALLSFVSVIVVTLFSLTFAIFNFSYHWIAFSTVLGAIAFSITTKLYLKKQIPNIKPSIFRFSFTKVSLIIIITGNLFFHPYIYYFNIGGIILYLASNTKPLKEVYDEIKTKLKAA